jgi:site-specific recombinase XerD
MLLSEAIDELCIATLANGRSPRTVEDYREKLGHLVAFLGNVAVECITTSDLRRYVADLRGRSIIYADHPARKECKSSLSPFTIQGRVRVLKRLFNFLEAEEVLESNTARRIKAPNPQRDEPKGIQWNDFVALLETTKGGDIHDVRDRAIILFLFDTACRVGGLCKLKPEDLDLERRRAKVREKGNKIRYVFFMPETARALMAWLEVRPENQGPRLFLGLSPRAKPELTTKAVGKMLERRGRQAGCNGPTNPHAFRHGFARHYLMNGGDLGTLSDLMGHTDVQVTKSFYGIFTTEELQEKHGRHSPIAKLNADLDWE